MNDLKLFGNRKPLKQVKPLRLKPQKLIKTALDVAIIGAMVGIGLGAYKKVTE